MDQSARGWGCQGCQSPWASGPRPKADSLRRPPPPGPQGRGLPARGRAPGPASCPRGGPKGPRRRRRSKARSEGRAGCAPRDRPAAGPPASLAELPRSPGPWRGLGGPAGGRGCSAPSGSSAGTARIPSAVAGGSSARPPPRGHPEGEATRDERVSGQLGATSTGTAGRAGAGGPGSGPSLERTRPGLTARHPREKGREGCYLPRKADSGQAWGRAGAVTSELWALRAIHRTAAATDTSSRSSDSKTAAIPVRALEDNCAGAGAPRAAWEGRGRPAERPLGGWAAGRGGGAEPGLPRLSFGSALGSTPRLAPGLQTAGRWPCEVGPQRGQ